jgi:tetratricopeptide (TPR) repeat protein
MQLHLPLVASGGHVVIKGNWSFNRLPIVILFGLLGVLPNCQGEEIYLKNGTSISADRVLEKGTDVIYQVGATSYTIPKSSVVRVVRDPVLKTATSGQARMTITVETPKADAWLPSSSTGTQPAGPAGVIRKSGRQQLAVAPPSESPASSTERELIQKLIVDGQVDERALGEFEKNSRPVVAAAADFLAGRFEMENGNAANAPEYFDRAIKLEPNEPLLLGWYAAALMKIGKNADALAAAKQASEQAPNSAEAFQLLGRVYYNNDKTKDAIAAWKHSLDLRADESLQKILDKAQKEVDSEETFREQQSEHFVVRYDGGQVSQELQRQILATLESAYRDFEHEFDFSPNQTMPVILYAQKAFFDITEAPSWASGANDGRLRIPVEGLQAMTPKLERVLRHELTHSFVAFITRGGCATWLNEGLAQLMEPKSSSWERQMVAGLFQRNDQIPLETLEQRFSGLDENEARVAYAESLIAVEYLRSKYGMQELISMLKEIPQRRSTQAALKARTRYDYDQLEKELGTFLSGSLAGAASGSNTSR